MPTGGQITEDCRFYLNELFTNNEDKDDQIKALIEMSFLLASKLDRQNLFQQRLYSYLFSKQVVLPKEFAEKSAQNTLQIP